MCDKAGVSIFLHGLEWGRRGAMPVFAVRMGEVAVGERDCQVTGKVDRIQFNTIWWSYLYVIVLVFDVSPYRFAGMVAKQIAQFYMEV